MAFRNTAGERAQAEIAAHAVGRAWQLASGLSIGAKKFDRHPAVLRSGANAKAASGPWSASWSEVATRYAALSEAPNAQILRLQLSHGDGGALAGALINATANMRTGDVVALDVAGKTKRRRGVTRDELGCALFKAGLENSLVWAARTVLREEGRAVSVLSALLPSSALGAGLHYLPGISGKLVPASDRIFCLARRNPLARPDKRRLTLSVVMPVYNEKATFREVIEKLLSKRIEGLDIEICVVESNSNDGTRADVLAYQGHPRVRIFFEDKPSGKGHAVRAGLGIARGDIILIQDADLEYDLDDYDKLLAPIRASEASFVLGSRHPAGEKLWKIRQFDGAKRLSDLLNVGHLFFTWLLNTVFEQRLRDPFTMYKVFRRDCIYGLRFECNRFDFDHEIVGKLVRNGYSPVEIDVRYHSRSFAEGKKVSLFGDPPAWIRACLKHRFSKLREWPIAAAPTVTVVSSPQQAALP
jgi:glycosyl transferase family 2